MTTWIKDTNSDATWNHFDAEGYTYGEHVLYGAHVSYGGEGDVDWTQVSDETTSWTIVTAS